MSNGQTGGFHSHHVNNAKTRLIESGDLYHEIIFEKDGRKQMLVLIPTGPTRATQAAAEAIAASDDADAMGIATIVWIKAVPEKLQNYKLGDVGNSTGKRELLIVVTADRKGQRLTSVREVIREGGGVRLEECTLSLPPGMIVPDMTPKSEIWTRRRHMQLCIRVHCASAGGTSS